MLSNKTSNTVKLFTVQKSCAKTLKKLFGKRNFTCKVGEVKKGFTVKVKFTEASGHFGFTTSIKTMLILIPYTVILSRH